METIRKMQIRNLTLSAMFLAMGLVMPFITGQIQEIGRSLLPMHIPVMLCGLICGWRYGLALGIITPLLRSALFAMPILFPTAVAMAAELGIYGLVIGLTYSKSNWQCIFSLYRSLLAAMISGRIVWGLVMIALLGLSGSSFTFKAFLSGALLNAIPGIIVQLVLIPVIMIALDRTKLVPFHKKTNALSKDTKQMS